MVRLTEPNRREAEDPSTNEKGTANVVHNRDAEAIGQDTCKTNRDNSGRVPPDVHQAKDTAAILVRDSPDRPQSASDRAAI
jgi:hypothetical protein